MNLPGQVESLGTSPEFDRDSVPDALLSRHAIADGRWARLSVLAGKLRYFDLDHDAETEVVAGDSHVVPPGQAHRVRLDEGTRFQLEFFRELE